MFKKGHIPWHKGKKIQLNTGRTHFKKGSIPWNKGTIIYVIKICKNCGKKFKSRKWRNYIYCSLSCRYAHRRGAKIKNWKGDKGSYGSHHSWLIRNFGKADKCESEIVKIKCSGKSKRFHWAKLKNKKYAHKRENYIQLCASCHRKYDGQKPNKGSFGSPYRKYLQSLKLQT